MFSQTFGPGSTARCYYVVQPRGSIRDAKKRFRINRAIHRARPRDPGPGQNPPACAVGAEWDVNPLRYTFAKAQHVFGFTSAWSWLPVTSRIPLVQYTARFMDHLFPVAAACDQVELPFDVAPPLPRRGTCPRHSPRPGNGTGTGRFFKGRCWVYAYQRWYVHEGASCLP